MPNPPTQPSPPPAAAKVAPAPPPAAPPATDAKTPPAPASKPTHPDRPPRHLPISLTTIVAILFLVFITQLSLLGILGKTLKTQITQAEIISRQTQDQQLAITSLDQYKTQIDQLTKSFPEETGIIGFVQFIQDRSTDFSKLDVQISNNEPIQTTESVTPFLPVSITATATPSAFIRVVNDLSSSPYLFQPALLEINSAAGLGSEASVKYFGNLYVSPELVKK